jgi:hypothetical protein
MTITAPYDICTIVTKNVITFVAISQSDLAATSTTKVLLALMECHKYLERAV